MSQAGVSILFQLGAQVGMRGLESSRMALQGFHLALIWPQPCRHALAQSPHAAVIAFYGCPHGRKFFQALCSSRKPLLSVRGGACEVCFFLRLQHPKACAWPWPHPCSRPWSLATGTCGILPQCWPGNLYLSLSLSLVGQQLRNYRRWFHCSRLGSRPSLRQRWNQRTSA